MPEEPEDNLEKTNEEHRGGCGALVFGIIVIICVGIYSETTKNPKDIVIWNYDGSFTLIEAKYFWGGSWFTKDFLKVSDTGFSAEKLFDSSIYYMGC